MTSVPIGKSCSVINCNKTSVSHGLCDTHRKRMDRHGTTDDSVGRMVIEGFTKAACHPLYEVWRNMTRINSGVEVCDHWKDFPNFVADVKVRPDGDFCMKRIDKNSKFSIDNVRWEPIIRGTNDSEARKLYMREYSRKQRSYNPDYFRNSNLKKSYGITLDDFNSMLSDQNGVCKICGKAESRMSKDGKPMNLHVDHCHATQRVRGLLCHHCNVALGSFKDSVETLHSAIDYLNSSQLT